MAIRFFGVFLSMLVVCSLGYGTSARAANPPGTAASTKAAPAPAQEKKEYLTDTEADKIRDAYEPAEKIHLFIGFAQDRLKKFEYEINRKTAELHRSDTLNGLLNGYEGCVDDAADLIQLGIEKDEDIRGEIKEMASKSKEFLATLQKIENDKGPELDLYKDTLDDAIDGTSDALREAEAAEKSYTPPVRRKQ
jgi:hypothetical protein